MIEVKPISGDQAGLLLKKYGLTYCDEVVLTACENDRFVGLVSVNPKGELVHFTVEEDNDLALCDLLIRSAMHYLRNRNFITITIVNSAAREKAARLPMGSFGDGDVYHIQDVLGNPPCKGK